MIRSRLPTIEMQSIEREKYAKRSSPTGASGEGVESMTYNDSDMFRQIADSKATYSCHSRAIIEAWYEATEQEK